jgi:hypothetical protein
MTSRPETAYATTIDGPAAANRRVVRGVALDRVALLALDADRDVTGDGHPVQAARLVVVVVDGVVLGDAVVEQDQLAGDQRRAGRSPAG